MEHKNGEVLYNGIRLPAQWPPADGRETNGKPPPYLSNIPSVIPIDVGRQLFVDDFLIEKTDLKRTFHNPVKYERNPIIKPETAAECVGGRFVHDYSLGATANPFDDAAFFDPKNNLFKMWCMAGSCHATELFYSKDGMHWDRPDLGVVPGTNIVVPYDPDLLRDSFSQWLDYSATDPKERFKGLYFARSKGRGNGGYLYTSPDGIHWTERARVADPVLGDNTLIFYNPFRKKWVLSGRHGGVRTRDYYEHDDFFGLAKADGTNSVFWSDADELDEPEREWVTQQPRQLYTLEAVAYESLMLGMFTIHYGPENPACQEGGYPKLTQLKIGFSRDGFHWDRSHRDVFIGATLKDGDWDRGYIRGCGGVCTVVGDKLFFYFSGCSGYNNDRVPYMYAGGSTHLAILRRDGFASMDAGNAVGELRTRPIRFNGRHLFLNANVPTGNISAEVIDLDGKVIEPFSLQNCVPFRGDSTKVELKWKGSADLRAISGQPVRLRFQVTRGELYAFWISQDPTGESNGYVAAGGPGFGGPMDVASKLLRLG